jgi:pyruvate/2-oxoglutarate/acetoin dehydrogenase E1 component
LFSATAVEDSFVYVDALVERIAGDDVRMSYGANLERFAFPQVIFLAISTCFFPSRFKTIEFYLKFSFCGQ